jgi:hypothetical protein
LEVHDVEEKVQAKKPPTITTVEVEESMVEPVCIPFIAVGAALTENVRQ